MGIGRSIRQATAIGVSGALLATGLTAAPIAAADLGPGKVLAGELDSFTAALVGVAGSDVLLEPLPLTTRSTTDLLSIEGTLVGSLRTPLATLGDGASISDLEAAVDGTRTVGASEATFDLVVEPEVPDQPRGLTLDVTITTTQQVPVLYRKVQLVDEVGDVVTREEALAAEDEAIINEDTIVALTGSSTDAVQVTASFTTSVDFLFDAEAPLGDQLRTDGVFDVTVDVDGTATDLEMAGAYGFADITVDGDVTYHLNVEGTGVDPDGTGGIRRAEWEQTLPEELIPLDRVDNDDIDDIDDIDVDLTFDSPQVDGDSDGTLTWQVADSSTGLGEPDLQVVPDLALFRNVTPADVLVATTQLATAVGVLHSEGDVEVPYTDSKLSRAYSPATVLQTVIQQFAVADIRCGRSNTSPPLGDDGTGNTWYCQAYTAEDPEAGSVQWFEVAENGDATEVTGTSDTTVGESPTSNVAFTGSTQPNLRVEWEVTDDEGNTETYTARPRFRTAGELQGALADAIDEELGSDAVGDVTVALGELDGSGRLEYDVSFTADPGENTDGALIIGDGLRTGTGLAGLTPKSEADEEIGIDLDDVSLDVTFGVQLGGALAGIATDDVDSRTDRFYLRASNEEGQVLSIGDVDAGPTKSTLPQLAGQVGFLGVDATLDEYTMGDSGEEDAVTVTLTDPGGDPQAGANTIGDGAFVLRHVTERPDLHSTAAFALEASGVVSVVPAGSLDDILDGEGTPAERTVSFTLDPLVPDARPTVTANEAFVTDLVPFDVNPTVAGFATAGTVEGEVTDPEGNQGNDPLEFETPTALDSVLEDTSQDFTTAFGFPIIPSTEAETAGLDPEEESQVAGLLLNLSTGAQCSLFEVVTATTLRCVDGLVGGVERDDRGVTVLNAEGTAVPDNSWHPGDRYEVKGDATALGRILVEGAGDLANDLDQHPSLDTELALVGASVREMLPQLVTLLDDTLVPILGRIGESGPPGEIQEDQAPEDQPISTLQDLDAALSAAGYPGALDVEAAANPLHDEAPIPHLTLRLGPITHDDATLAVDGIRAELSGRALRLDPVGDAPEADLSSSVQLDLAAPLHAEVSAQRLLVLKTTGVTASSLSFDADDLDLTGTYGPLAVRAGVTAKLTGTAKNATGTHTAPAGTIDGFSDVTGTATGGSTGGVIDTHAGFVAAGVLAGGTLYRTAEDFCVVGAVTAAALNCQAGDELSTAFAADATYRYEPTASLSAFTTTAALGDVVAGSDSVVADNGTRCVIAEVNAGELLCEDLASGAGFTTTAGFTVESPTVLVHGTASLVDTYETGDRVHNADENASCKIATITATTITCQNALTGNKAWSDGDTWVLTKGDDGTVLLDPGVGFDDLAIEGGTVTNTTDGFSCTITDATADTVTCDDEPTAGTKNRWESGHAYEITGPATGQLDSSFTLLTTSDDPVLLDGASDSFDGVDADRFADTLDPDLDGPGTPNTCAGGTGFTGGDACFRLTLAQDLDDGDATNGDELEFLGVAEWYADVDGDNQGGSVPQRALDAAEAAEIAVNEIATATLFLSDIVGGQLDGYNVATEDTIDAAWDPTSTLLPLVGADLSAAGGHDDGLSVEDAVATLGGALAGIEDHSIDQIDTAAELAAVVDGLLADSSLDGVLTAIGTAEVLCATGGGAPADCGEDALTLVDDVQVSIAVGKNLTTAGDAPDKGCAATCGTATGEVPFDSGLPGLDFTAEVAMESRYAWKLNLTFGISRTHGPYIRTDGTDEFTLGAAVSVPDGDDCTEDKPADNIVPANTPTKAAKPSSFAAGRCFDAQLGLVKATVFDGNTALTGTEAKDASNNVDWSEDKTQQSRLDLATTIDLAAPGGADRLDLLDLLDGVHDSTTTVDADANVDLWFRTHKDLPGGNLPQMQGGLHFAFDQDQMVTCLAMRGILEIADEDADAFYADCGAQTDMVRYPLVGDIEYRGLVIDLRSFFSDLLGPWIGDVAGVIGTIRPVADALLTPIPGLSQLAELTGQQPVTAFALMQEISGNELTLIYNLLEFLQFADVVANGSAETVNDDDGVIGIGGATQIDEFGFPTGVTSEGGFKYDADDARGTGPCGAQLPSIGGHRGGKTQKRFKPKDCKKSGTDYGKGGQASKLKVDASLTGFSATKDSESVKQLKDCPRQGCTGKELARTVSKKAGVELGAPGIWFPFLADANEMFGMLTGRDAQLVRLDLGTLEASVGLSIGFGPFMAGPVPIEIGIGGSITASMRTMVGLDTLGLRTTGKLLDGFFIEDLDPLNGYDVYEIQVVFTISVYAAVSLRVVKAGLEGEIEIGIGANLQDPDGDGRVRPDELAMYGGEWWCAFGLEGYLSFVARVFVELDFKLWSKRWAYDLFRKSWVLFSIQCEPDPPALATEVTTANATEISGQLTTAAGRTVTVQAGDLVLNVGPRNGDRNVDEDETNETVSLRQMEPTGTGLAACPPSQDADGDGDPRNDKTCPPPPDCPGTNPTVCTGVLVEGFGISQEFRVGTGRRVVAVTASTGGDGDADTVQLLEGSDPTGAGTFPFTLPSEIHLGADKDRFTGGEGPDVVYGGDDRDALEGNAGDDRLYGDGGADTIKGEAGNDTVDGGDDVDRLAGGPGADLILGGAGNDSLTGGPGLTEALAGRIVAAKYPNETTAQKAARVERVADLGDTLVGGQGDDEIAGQLGDDLAVGDDLDGHTGALDHASLVGLTGTTRAALLTNLCTATTGTGGQDRVEGATGDDALIGGPGHDQLMGGRGDDLICGLAGHDTLQGDDENPNLPGGEDDMRGGDGDDRLLGRAGDDLADGGAGNDLVEGGDGDDRLIGGPGSDVVVGDRGYDIALGDEGAISAGTRSTPLADRVTLAGDPGAAGTGSVECAVLVTVIDGQLDMDGDADIDADDDGLADGIPVVAGKLNLDRTATIAENADLETTIDDLDSGIVRDLIVTAGILDIDGDGTVDGDDDGTAPLVTHRGIGDADCLLGGTGDDGLYGGGDADYLLGDAGEDTVYGNGGNDEARGGSEDDTVSGGAGDDTVFGDGDDDTLTGDDGNDLLYGGSGADHVEGNAGDDEAHGEGGADVVIGGSSTAGAPDGDDVLYGNAGADIVIGDNGTASNDGSPTWEDPTLHDQPLGGAAPTAGLSGNDDLDGGAGADVLLGGSGDDTIVGDGPGIAAGLAGADHIEGNAGDDTIDGNEMTDRLIGGSSAAGITDGNDTIGGGGDSDTIVGDNARLTGTPTVSVSLYDLALVGLTAPDAGLSGDDRIWGGDRPVTGRTTGTDLADRVYGQGANDTISGGAGADHLEGNHGDDTITGDDGEDIVIGGSSADQGGTNDATRVLDQVIDGNDILSGGTDRDHLLGDNARGVRSGSAVAVILGNIPFVSLPPEQQPSASLAGGDTINGGDAGDVIYGQSGNDTIAGDDGDDVVEGGDGNDTISGGGGDDDLVGGSGKDQATPSGNTWTERKLFGVTDGNDTIAGNAGNDLIAGDNARTFTATVSNTIVHLIELHDVPFTDLTTQPAATLAGADTIDGGAGTDEVYGQSGNDTIAGGTDDDRIEGGAGTDTIGGDDGNDDIAGGSGHDDGGLNGALRELPNVHDAADTIEGDAGTDHIAGDNASQTRNGTDRRTKLHDIPFTNVTVHPATAGGDTIWGDDATPDATGGAADLILGQSGNDTIRSQAGDDEVHGGDGADVIMGGAGGDDLIGGSSFDRGGASGAQRKLSNVRDAAVGALGDTIWGATEADPVEAGDAGDVIAGDNARITSSGGTDPNRSDTRIRAVELFDVTVAGGYQANAATSGPDSLHGQTGRDLLFGQGANDLIRGGDDDDHLEGNAGDDTLHGDADRDDIIGGSSTNPGGKEGSIVGTGAFPSKTDVADGSDTIYGDGAADIVADAPAALTHSTSGDDAIVADNGKIGRAVDAATSLWLTHPAPYSTLLKRELLTANVAEAAGAFGNDTVFAGEGHDEVHGQLGSDIIHGNAGDDAVMADLGRYWNEVVLRPNEQNDPRTKPISADSNFIHEVIYRPYTLFRKGDVFEPTSAGGADWVTGGAGNDVVHGGFGNDTINGHGNIARSEIAEDPATVDIDDPDKAAVKALDDACIADLDTVVPTFAAAGGNGQLACDEDMLFGGDGNDRIWGGPGHDQIYGGHGADHLDVVYAGFDSLAGNPDVDFKGVDYIFGGWGGDALQADVSQPSPNGLDKLIDAAGAHNAYFVCEGAYGGNSIVRVLSPQMVTFLEQVADGAGGVNVPQKGSSGYRDLANIYKPDIKSNTNPIHPETPGNFTCGDPAPAATAQTPDAETASEDTVADGIDASDATETSSDAPSDTNTDGEVIDAGAGTDGDTTEGESTEGGATTGGGKDKRNR